MCIRDRLSTILVVESEKDNLTDILRQIEGILKESERFYVKDIIDDRLVILSSIMVSQKDDGIIATEIELSLIHIFHRHRYKNT